MGVESRNEAPARACTPDPGSAGDRDGPSPAPDPDASAIFFEERTEEADRDAMIALGGFGPGTRLGRYRIEATISAGGMGTVFLASQAKGGGRVALKLMRKDLSTPSALRRFRFEAATLARLRHPGIARVYETGTFAHASGAVPYFAMEYVPNARSIVEHAREAGLDRRRRIELFAKACEAVAHGHRHGIIHRDIKPANILVGANGEPRIIDFGVARAVDEEPTICPILTDDCTLVGTLQYMSPEQCVLDPRKLDARSDVYALGLVLYELLCGRRPYELGRLPLPEAARMICECEPVRPSRIDPALAGGIENIVLKALRKDRARRYRSAAGLVSDVRRYLNAEPVTARRLGPLTRLGCIVRRRTAMVVAILAIIALLATLVGLLLLLAHHARDHATLPLAAPGSTVTSPEVRAGPGR